MSEMKPSRRQQIIFTVSSVLIGLLLVASVIGVLTGKFRPSADEPNNGVNDFLRTITINNGVLQYKDSSNNDGRAGINSVNLTPLASQVSGTFSLQGLDGRLDKLPQIDGSLAVYKASNKELVAETRWSSTENQTNSIRKFSVTDMSFKQKMANADGPFIVVLKPDTYLAVALKNVTNIFDPMGFSQDLAGDLNNDNCIDEGDYAKFIVFFNKDVTNPASGLADFNKDGHVDEADYAIGYTTNFDKCGEKP